MSDYNKPDYDSLLNTCFEIEGLISLMRLRDNESPEEVYELLKSKVAMLSEAFDIQPSTPSSTDTADAELIASAAEFEETDDAGEGIFVDDFDIADEPTPMVPTEPMEPVVDDEPSPFDEPRQEPQAPHTGSLFDDFDFDTPELEAPLKVEEAIAIEQTTDLRNAFAINDKFRFRRELFRNSDVEFMDTLNLLQVMGSYQEAEEYLYNDLHWNPEDENVRDFMVVVHNFFASKGRV